MLLSNLLLSWQIHLKAQSYVRKVKTLYQFACINLPAESYLRNKKGPKAVKQEVLLFWPPQAKAAGRRYSLWLVVRSGLQNTFAHCLGNVK